MAFLIIESGPDAGKKVDLRGPLVIGRQAKTGLTIHDVKASREHAKVECVSGAWCILDLASSNGTQLNGRRVEREFLQAGDRISVGQTVFRFEDADADPAQTTRPMKESGSGTPVGVSAPGAYPPAAAPATPRPSAAGSRPVSTEVIPPAGPPAPAVAAVAPIPGKKLRFQDQPRGPGFVTIAICTAILVGLVFAARWIGQRAITKAMDERKQEQK